jgi:tetratricopeptide (TPR) repeat protein
LQEKFRNSPAENENAIESTSLTPSMWRCSLFQQAGGGRSTMTKALRNSPRKKPGHRYRYQWLMLVLALFGGALLAAGLGVANWRRTRTTVDSVAATPPPSIDPTGVDPAVIAAIESARKAVRQSPRSASAWGQLGMILSAHNFASEANVCLVQAEALDPHDPRWPYYQGTELCLNEPTVAIPKLQRAAELCDSRFDGARLRLGELLLRQGRPDDAEEQFRRVLQQNPANARAHLNLARIARERGNFEIGLEHLQFAAADKYTRKAAHLLAAEIHQRLGNKVAANQERQLAIKLPKDPDWPDRWVEEVFRLRTGRQVRLAVAAQLITQGRFREAAESLRQMVKDYPDSDWAWLLFGRALLGQNDLVAAETPLRTAIQLAPASMEAHFYLGVVLLLQGNPQSAAACFREALAIKPDFAEAHHNLAHCLLRQGDRKAAIEAWQAALNCKPNYVEAHLDLAEALAQEGQSADALSHVRYAAQLNPSNQKAKNLLEQMQRVTK